MPLRDLGLEIKLGAKNAGRGAINQAKRLKPVEASANSAAKYSNMEAKAAMDPDKLSLDIIKLIDQATMSGEYIICTKIASASCEKVAMYFMKKGFILATNDKKSVLAICWMGGSTWRKFNCGSDKINDATKKSIADSIKAQVTQSIMKEEKNTKKIKWINPKKNNPSPNELSRIWLKLK